jgi:hypothetical protein
MTPAEASSSAMVKIMQDSIPGVQSWSKGMDWLLDAIGI